ncbi:MAG: M24 family metallopeptidase [bacterium]
MTKAAAQIQAINKIAKVWPLFLKQVKPELTEKQVACLLWQILKQQGFAKKAFRFIVATGASAAEPHHWPTNKKLIKGQAVKIDFGVTHRGWKTDITRTVFLDKPTNLQKKLYQLVFMAQQQSAKLLKPGIPAQTIDSRARSIIKRAGYGKYFIHSTGHGVGKQIHEPPWLSPTKKGLGKLKIGDVVTIEPGIYLPGRLGIRIEDMYLITKTGSRHLTGAIPRDLQSNILA